MASYSATIEVGTKGTAALEKLLARINTLSGSIDKVNRSTVFGSKQVASLNEYNRALKEATANLAKTRVVLDKSGQAAGNYAKAIKTYVDALGSANGAQDLTNKLVQQEIQGREKATAALKKYNAAAASARQPGGSMAGRYMRPGAGVSTAQAYSSPIGPEPSFVFSGQSTAVGGRIKAIKAAQAAMVAAETEVNRVTRTFEQQETAREKANDKLIFDRKMALLDAEHQKTLKLNKKENDAALKNFDQRLNAQTKKRAAQAKAEAGRSRKFTDIATGAGFPLLFGGGPLQALAGGLGGAAGGLGGSIAASAIAAQVEQVIKASAELGQALNPLTLDLERVAEASGFAGTKTQQFLQKIQQYAEATEAARLATALLETKIGKGGVKALKDFGESAVTLGNNLSVIFTQVLAAIAKAAGPLLDGLAKFAGEQADVGSFLARGAGTSQEKLAQEILKTNFTRTKGELTTSSSQALQEFSKRSIGLGGQGFKTAAEAKTFATGVASSSQRRVEQPILQEIETLAGTLGPEQKTKKGRESRLPQLQAEVALQERLAVLGRQVVKAKEEENPVREAALNMEIALEKRATAIEKINLKTIPPLEKAEEIKKAGLAADKEIFGIQDKLNASKAAQAKKAAETLKGLQGEQDLLQARLDGRLEEEQLEQRVNKILENNKDLTREQVEQSLQGTAALKEQVKALEKLESMYASIGQSISSGIVDALSAAVEGTKSLADVASQTLRQVANILLQFGVNTALGGIPGFGSFFGGGRAAGGPVSGGTPYMVGERGPELFVPNTSGNIVPNNKLGGGGATNVVVNVDAKGSSASGDTGSGKQLGGLIGAAVQAELIKQQRPGGLLAR